jgi:small conductance mechanosensitive channel
MTFDIQKYLSEYIGGLINYLPHLLGAFFLLVIGLWVIKRLLKLLDKFFTVKSYDPSLESFTMSIVSLGLKLILFITVAGLLGFQTTSLVAIFGALGLAVGLALQGSLSNFAGGVLILIFRPFKVGDYVTVLNESGYVHHIQIFNTIIVTLDNKTVILPNGALMNNTITNHSEQGTLLVDLKMKLNFEDDFSKAKQVILDVMNNNPKALKTPIPHVEIINIEEDNIIITMRCHAKWDEYWDVYFYNFNHLQKAFCDAKIVLPKPDRYVYMMNKDVNG